MTDALLHALCFCAALAAMEGVAYFTHRFVMHGFLWSLHESHHVAGDGWFERNDWFVVLFASPSIALIYVGNLGLPAALNGGQPGAPVSLALALGLGVAAYGLIYFLFHDVLVHRRIPHGWQPKGTYLRRIIHAHRLHHATAAQHGAVSFGFLVAAPAARLREQMRQLEAAGRTSADDRAYRRGQ